MQRVTDLADPHRCKGSRPEGQCLNRAEDESEYCVACGGIDRGPTRRLRGYLLAQVQDQVRLAQFADDDSLKSLRDELGLLKMMIEHTWNSAKTDVEKLSAYSKINTFLLTAERLTKTLVSIEKSLGSLLERQAVLRLGQKICQIIVTRLEGIPNYEQIVDSIITEIVATIQHADNGSAPVE